MQLIDGKQLAEILQKKVQQQVVEMVEQGHKIPHLAAILVGNDPASTAYVNNKIRMCRLTGLEHTLVKLPDTVTEEALLQQIARFNQADFINGFIVQLPLPSHINTERVIQAIDPEKDVDGFHPTNIGRMTQGLPSFLPATPYGIMQMLEHYNIETAGKHAVVLGRSNIVGTPMSILLSRNTKPGNCTVTLCHSRTPQIEQYTQQADILVAALGKPNFVTANMVKQGAVVIDVGINHMDDDSEKGYHLVGDVDFANVAPKCSYITPVPGGVGAMTVISLILNTLTATKNKVSKT